MPSAKLLGVQTPILLTHTGNSGPLSKNHDENPRLRKIFNSKSPPKVRACAYSRHDLWTMDLKFW